MKKVLGLITLGVPARSAAVKVVSSISRCFVTVGMGGGFGLVLVFKNLDKGITFSGLFLNPRTSRASVWFRANFWAQPFPQSSR